MARPDPAAPEVVSAGDLGIDADHPVARQVRGRAHPDLLVLERPRGEDGGATKTVIPVEQVRRLVRFLGSTASAGGWRVVIVDPADDLNRAAANALLKMLEEPPRRTVFLLVAHLPGRLLPTIRSRCRRIVLKPLPDAAVAAMLAAAGADRQA
ncbi:MAG: DNA polymerase III subunit delta', partial [Gammaproteobacteria bacterium]|nr:DNA polymerase III subunit delta' [Gammaproteobacteria bacterium]